jgi:uncharacterized protein involved in exopolysaccharide biosynthesis
MLPRSSNEPGGYAPLSRGETDAWHGGGDAFDFREIVRVVQRRLPVIAGLALLGTLMATIYAFQLTPLYTAGATLMIEPRKTKITNSEAVLSDIGKDWEAIASEVELIRSIAIARRVAQKLGLAESATAERPEQTIGGLLQSVSLTGRESPPILEPDEITPHAYAVRGGLAVSRKRDTYLIQISYTHSDPRFAARAANAFARPTSSTSSKPSSRRRGTPMPGWIHGWMSCVKGCASPSARWRPIVPSTIWSRATARR